MKQLFNSENLYQILTALTSSKQIFIAFSGGLDSQVLLHALKQIQIAHPEFKLSAIHVNHSLSTEAEKWEKHCREICLNLSIPLISKQVDATIKINDHSPEEIARNLRYQVFAEILPKNAVLVTAHQADDQAETLLLQLFRGAGPKGLAAMQACTHFAQGLLVRPLLQFTRAELEQYATTNNLLWIEDPSNLDVKYKRNFLRHEILPKLREKWPGITATLNRVAGHCAEANTLLETLAAQDLLTVLGTVAQTLSIAKLCQLDIPRQHNIIRYWLQQLQLTTPSNAKLEQIQKTVLQSNPNATPVVTWHGGEVRRFQGNIYAIPPLPKHDNSLVIPWNLQQSLALPNALGMLTVALQPDMHLDTSKITVRFRKGGETIKLRGHTHSLKKLFQEWQIPPWQRERTPLIFYGDELIAVGDYAVADNCKLTMTLLLN